MASIWLLSQINISKQLSRNSVLSNIIQRSCARTQGIPLPNIRPKAEQKFQVLDRVPSSCILIYKSPIANTVKYCYYGSIILSVFGLFGIYFIFKNRDDMEPPKQVNLSCWTDYLVQPQTVLEGQYMFAFMIVSNLFLAIWCRRHVPRIWFYPKTKEFILCHHGDLPGLLDHLIFKPGTAKLKYKNPRSAISRTAHLINGKTYYINEMNFRTPADYEKVTGSVALE